MQRATELGKLNRQLGQYIVEFKDGKINGYIIRSFTGFEPNEIELVNVIDRPDRVTSWDTAYDMLFGAPTAPDFSKVLSN